MKPRRVSFSSLALWQRPGIRRAISSLGYYAKGLYHRAGEDHIFLTAGGLAFSVFACIVPFVLIVFSILGRILEESSVQREIISYIDNFIPYADYAAYVKKVIFSRIDEFRHYRMPAGYVGMAGLMFAASGLFSSIRTILNRTYRVEIGKHVAVAKLRDFGMVLVVLLFFLVSILALPALEIVKDSAHQIKILEFIRLTTVQNVLFGAVSLVVVFGVFFTLYYLVPYGRIGAGATVLSALCATVLWEIAKQIFGYYITNVATMKRIYGTYVLVIVVAFWVYYTSAIFIVSAVIGQLYRERRQVRSGASSS